MKTATMIMTLLSTTLLSSAFAADKCQKEVYANFLTSTAEYDYHTLSDTGTKYEAGVESFKSYGVTVELGYDIPVISYQASNEYMSGYGAYEIIVNPVTCKILDMVVVYSE